jgi:hypothetical protein
MKTQAIARTAHGLPMSVPRPAARTRVRPAPSARRAAIEAHINTATRESPLTAEQIAGRIGVDPAVVRPHISNICACGRAHNTTAGQQPAMYAPGPAPLKMPARTTERRHAHPDHYDGAELRPYTGRPGAMDAFALPSLRGGVRMPHRPPIGIGSSVEGKVR